MEIAARTGGISLPAHAPPKDRLLGVDLRLPEAAPGAGGGADARVLPRGKFFYAGAEKFYVRGVTYGGFRPRRNGEEFPEPAAVEIDLLAMKSAGINSLRTYTVPPRWLIDAAARHGIRILAGIPWEQHVAFLDDRALRKRIRRRIAEGVRACAGRAPLLGYAIGNEIPSPVVRWHGPRRIEEFLRELYLTAKEEDPDAPVTYVNYPSTEYLQLPFLDFAGFNVFLETRAKLEPYLHRLQNIAGNRPLLLTETGLDSLRHGEEGQAAALDWQLRTAAAAGCAGSFVFAWTDEWHRGGHDVDDWAFGLTRKNRTPKESLARVSAAFADAPFPRCAGAGDNGSHPFISVVVCVFNGEKTIRECLEGLSALDYPSYEVIVVDDGSFDATASIVREFPVRVVALNHGGLSAARNAGWRAARGSIVAYIDADASPDPHWLAYLASTFAGGRYAAVGGPNIPPANDGVVAASVARAPGNPIHVLLSDTEAEHIPGCNMAFRRDALAAINGFDERFRIAGDDVDLCWRIQEQGWKLGFSPGAVVWHHCRDTLRGFWRQQLNYGKAEAMLEEKWPEKYNGLGHLTWKGRMYAGGRTSSARSWHVYYGVWGTGAYQSIYERTGNGLAWLPLMPEWYLLLVALGSLTLLGEVWAPFFLAAPLFAAAAGILVLRAFRSAAHPYPSAGDVRQRTGRSEPDRALILLLHLVQPLARLRGRLRLGLAPWRRRKKGGWVMPLRRAYALWSEQWRAGSEWTEAVESALRREGGAVARGGACDRWDVSVRYGASGSARLIMMAEEHGTGRQLVRVSAAPRVSAPAFALFALSALTSAGSAVVGGWPAALFFGLAAAAALFLMVRDAGFALGAVDRAARRLSYRRQQRGQPL